MFFFQVLEAHCRGIVHSPTLWYYDLLKFLNDYRPEDNSVKIEYYEVLILLRKLFNRFFSLPFVMVTSAELPIKTIIFWVF